MADRQTIAVTGANGFLGANLTMRLLEEGHDVRPITRATSPSDLKAAVSQAQAVFHLAGVNRPEHEGDFLRCNRDYTHSIAAIVAGAGNRPLIVYSSSAKALDGSPYGRSKLAGEQVLLDLAERGAATVSIWRLPNLFGKWSRPNYNSVVATFCHNAARGLPLRIDAPGAPLALLYIDDLIEQWLDAVADPPESGACVEPSQVHHASVGELADTIRGFAAKRQQGSIADLGSSFRRALYSCFISALPLEGATYRLDARTDDRGSFVEVLRAPASGQISYFTAHPGVTRGGHYHHSKVEKFNVVHGTGRFRFRHVLTGEVFELTGSAAEPMTIETIPGWAHDVTNVGDDELVVLTWANQPFDPERPDTHPLPL